MAARKPKRNFEKELHERKKKRLTGLRSSLEKGPMRGSKVVIEPRGQVKMSDVLAEFVSPYADDCEDLEAYRKLLNLGMLAWNAAVVPGDRGWELVERTLRKSFPRDPALLADARAMASDLVQRKQACFASIDRLIVSFELTERPSGWHLSVASTLTVPPQTDS